MVINYEQRERRKTLNRNANFLILVIWISLIFAGCSSPEDIADKDRTGESERERASSERDVSFGLESITLSTQDSSVFAGHSTKVYVHGNYINGTTKNISENVTYTVEDDNIIAFIDSEDVTIITSKNEGVGKITASIDSFKSDTELTVEAAKLEQIYFFPDAFNAKMGEEATLSVSGVYSNALLKDVSEDCPLTSSDPDIVSVNDSGANLHFLTVGKVTITAECSSTTKSMEIEVGAPSLVSIQFTTPNIVIPMGISSSMPVTGTLTNGEVIDLSSLATLTSDSVGTASSDPDDLSKFKSILEGVAVVKATYEGFVAVGSVTVIAATAESVNIDGSITSIAKGKTLQLKGNVNYSDGTTVDMSDFGTWTTANASTASLLGDGLIDANAQGTVDIEFEFQGYTSTLSITVSAPVLESMAVFEKNDLVNPLTFLNIIKGNFEDIVVVGYYSDGSNIDVTSSAAVTPGAAGTSTLENNVGVFSLKITGTSAGSNQLTLAKDGINYSIPLIVTPAELLSITVESSDSSTKLGLGLTNDFVVKGVYTDTTPTAITIDSTTVSWSVSFAGGTPFGWVDSTTNFGRVHAVAVGLFNVHAEIDGKTAQYAYETIPPIPLEIYINTLADGALTMQTDVGSDILGRVKVDLSDGSTIDVHDLAGYTASITLTSVSHGYQAVPFSLSLNTIDGDSRITLSANDFGVVSANIELTNDGNGLIYIPTSPIYLAAKAICNSPGKSYGDYDVFTDLGCYFMDFNTGPNDITENKSCTDICGSHALTTHPAAYSLTSATCPAALALFAADMVADGRSVGTFYSNGFETNAYGCSYEKHLNGLDVIPVSFSNQLGDDSALHPDIFRLCSCSP
jgi:hypothetical protein